MHQTWFTADTHFGHANIVKYSQRPFLSDDEWIKLKADPRGPWKVSRETIDLHDEQLILAINDLVQPDDELWFLGDFCWGKEKAASEYLDRIHCRNCHLVWGNHDHSTVGSQFKSTMHQGMIRVQGQLIWLNHYPMRSWDGRFHGSWHLYGHVHNRFTSLDEQSPHSLTRDVGVDACNYKPISFDQLAEYMQPRTIAFNEVRNRVMKGDSVDVYID